MPRQPLLALNSALSHATADKRVDILRLVAKTGSISQAARDAGVSYKAAWQAIDTLTNLAGVPLVESAVGGAGGGGARITEAGLQLLAAADELAQARGQVLARLQAGGATDAVAPLSIRTSMRNQLPCRVAALEDKGQIVRVRLALSDGSPLASRITRESAELLGLQEGLPVYALCKATAVTVRRAGERSASGNLLPGRAARVSRGESGDEVAATLEAGLQLVGFAPASSGLRAGSRVVMAMDESAVVIALAG